MKEIESERYITKWIDVNDRLPEKGDDVLVVIQDKDNHFHTEIRWRSLNDDVIVDDNGFAIYPPVEERVLAWLPIPVYKVENKHTQNTLF